MPARRIACVGPRRRRGRVLLAACGSSSGGGSDAGRPGVRGPTGPHVRGAALLDWPEFGLNPQRSDASERATGITAANVAHLRQRTVALPGTVDSSPIYLHGASVDGAMHETIVVTTTYGRTLAIDADSGQILWTFTPPGYSSLGGHAADHDREPARRPRPAVRLRRLARSA